MKITKKRWIDLLWIIALIILFFTPLGKTIKVQINRLIAFSPSVIQKEDAMQVNNDYWIVKSLETGEKINFSDLKGQVIFINHWATWCPPCLAEMPDIDALYKTYKDKVVFLITTSDHKTKVNTFMETEGYTFKNYTSLTSVPANLGSNALPHTLVIDKQGYIRVDKIGAAKWNAEGFRETLDKMLNE